jgi:hypothetical protein
VSKESKKALNIYLDFAAFNNALPPAVALIPNSGAPSAPINLANCSNALGLLEANYVSF